MTSFRSTTTTHSKMLAVVLVVLLPIMTLGRPAGCPGDFFYDSRVNGCYKVDGTQQSWHAASAACGRRGAHLVAIENRQEQGAINVIIGSDSQTYNPCRNLFGDGPFGRKWGGYWTAGQRINPNENTAFVWRLDPNNANVYASFGYTDWIHGEPDFANSNEACMLIWTDSRETRRKHTHWNDFGCHKGLCSVCEIDMRRIQRRDDIKGTGLGAVDQESKGAEQEQDVADQKQYSADQEQVGADQEQVGADQELNASDQELIGEGEEQIGAAQELNSEYQELNEQFLN